MEGGLKPRTIWFSSKHKLDSGVWTEDGWIKARVGEYVENILPTSEIGIPGVHNVENILTVVALSLGLGVDKTVIRRVVKSFSGVAHRIEQVGSIKGAKYFNDSKGTNPDSSIKALNALDSPIILIAGGYDKGSDFEELLKVYASKGKALILLGATSNKLAAAASELEIAPVFLASDMESAVSKAYELSEEGDNILLSPACASWDMYKNYEERGDHFRELVRKLME